MTESKGMVIRPEQASDYRTVEELTREAFWNVNVPGCDEHFLAHRLRSHADFIPELDFVAVFGDKIAGNIMYTKAKIVSADGIEHLVLTFGPLSILPELQKQGIGLALIRHSFSHAQRHGYKAVLIYGDPEYYYRFGFRPAEMFGITTGEGQYHPALQAMELKEGALTGISGRFLESPAYHLDENQAAAFDVTFPPKEKFITESQRRFARLAGLPVPEKEADK
ncbi:GNAT family N-acetyltransferase [Desulfosporosinus sp.]|uniref:GNAT family N-acetyltransferase n=1 Tax=Desulfosporosinus sp. TaxID=157907 RepID=UPI0025C371F3|nr:N-acetyltransferase [Desulfosporosinus sp.]